MNLTFENELSCNRDSNVKFAPLARQKTLAKIAQATKRRLEVTNKPLKPPPPKFLIPLIERASLEDVNDTKLVNMWANLIATAATEEVELLGQYTTILSEITSNQVKILGKILDIKTEDLYDAGHIVDMYWMLNQSGLPGTVNSLGMIEDIEDFAEALTDEFYRMGVALDTINIYHADKHKDGAYSISHSGNLRPDLNFYDYENLVRLGLLSRCEIKGHIVGKYDVDVLYYIITPVGVDLYACCNPTKLIRENRCLPKR